MLEVIIPLVIIPVIAALLYLFFMVLEPSDKKPGKTQKASLTPKNKDILRTPNTRKKNNGVTKTRRTPKPTVKPTPKPTA